MKAKNSYRKEIRKIMMNKITDCDETIQSLTDEARNILISSVLNFPRISEICQQVNGYCCEKALLQELLSVRKPSKKIKNLVSEMSQIASTGHL